MYTSSEVWVCSKTPVHIYNHLLGGLGQGGRTYIFESLSGVRQTNASHPTTRYLCDACSSPRCSQRTETHCKAGASFGRGMCWTGHNRKPSGRSCLRFLRETHDNDARDTMRSLFLRKDYMFACRTWCGVWTPACFWPIQLALPQRQRQSMRDRERELSEVWVGTSCWNTIRLRSTAMVICHYH